ncbi:MAG: hypothetical protein Q9220_002934 [cf. Caloplaca sp. 1 TL-2023]
MSQAAQPSLLEYARFYGVCHNHLEVNPLELVPLPEDIPLSTEDELEWAQSTSGIKFPPPERLVAVREASNLLAVTNPRLHEGSSFECDEPLPTYRIRNLKHELPLLRSDHEADMMSFMHHVEPNLAEEFIPSEKVDDELDEGMQWPSHYNELPQTYWQKAQGEKLEVAKDIFMYISSVLDARTYDSQTSLVDDWPIYKRSKTRQPITPPLLRRSPSPQPFEPSSETGRLDCLSTHSSPTRGELEEVRKRIVERDAVPRVRRYPASEGAASELGTEELGDLYSPLKGTDRASSLSPLKLKRKRRDDLKVEGPLTPPKSDRPPPWVTRKLSLNDTLQGFIPSLELLPLGPEHTSSEDIDAIFAEQIAPIAAKAERAIEQEQLQEADTTCRVLVPVMDFGKPVAPWAAPLSSGPSGGEVAFLRDIIDSYLDRRPWPLDARIMKDLAWAPFPSALGRVDLQETIEDDGTLAALIAEPEAVGIDLESSRPRQLRILDENDESDDEELGRADFSPAKDVSSLVKKRAFELAGSEDLTIEPTDQEFAIREEVVAAGTEQVYPMASHQGKRVSNESRDFSVANAMAGLDGFLGVRSGKVQMVHLRTEKRPSETSKERATVTRKTLESKDDTTVLSPSCAVPTPRINLPTVPRFFIASTIFLSDRKVAGLVRELYPSAQIIERDLAPHSLRPIRPVLSMNTQRTSNDVLSDEADLILSPSTGLILTSLQKVKQQALPGQNALSPIRERIQRTAARYERLVVLISVDEVPTNINAPFTGSLDESDCEAITSLTVFLDQLSALREDEVLLIGSDKSTLATWVVSIMIKYSSDASTKLLQDETQWEVFLRQAGMNAFAAQAVLAEMKSIQEREGGTWGLREFVLKTPEERLQRFESMLGSRGILERVGTALDARW